MAYGQGSGGWGSGPGQTQSRDPGAEGKAPGSKDAGGYGDNRGAGNKSGFGGIGTNKSPTPAGATVNGPKDYNSMMSGMEDPDVIKGMNEDAEQAQEKYADYLDKSVWDRIKAFLGFHEENPYKEDGTVDLGEDGDNTAEVGFDPFNAPIIGIGLSLIPGIGPLLGAGYGVLSGLVNGNPLQAAFGAVPVIGGLLGPVASAVTGGIGTLGNLAGVGANIAGYNGLDDALGTDIDITKAFSGTGTTPANRGFSGTSDGGRGGDPKRGFGTVSTALVTPAANDNTGTGTAGSQTNVSPQQQTQLRSLYGMVSGVGEGDGGDGMEPKASQGFGGRANQMTRTAYRYK